MNYELALELEQAGYPQVYVGGRFEGHLDEAVYVPTLSELIAACPTVIGDEDSPADFTLKAEGDIWTAGYYGFEDWREFADGATPEEAVARLWLALNPQPEKPTS